EINFLWWYVLRKQRAPDGALFRSRGLRRSDLGRQLHLGQAEAVAGWVAEAAVDPVGPLLRRFGELDPTGPQLLVGGLAVVGGEEDGAGEALAHQGLHLLLGL